MRSAGSTRRVARFAGYLHRGPSRRRGAAISPSGGSSGNRKRSRQRLWGLLSRAPGPDSMLRLGSYRTSQRTETHQRASQRERPEIEPHRAKRRGNGWVWFARFPLIERSTWQRTNPFPQSGQLRPMPTRPLFRVRAAQIGYRRSIWMSGFMQVLQWCPSSRGSDAGRGLLVMQVVEQAQAKANFKGGDSSNKDSEV